MIVRTNVAFWNDSLSLKGQRSLSFIQTGLIVSLKHDGMFRLAQKQWPAAHQYLQNLNFHTRAVDYLSAMADL